MGVSMKDTIDISEFINMVEATSERITTFSDGSYQKETIRDYHGDTIRVDFYDKDDNLDS